MSDPDRQAFIPTKPSNRPSPRAHGAPRAAWNVSTWDAALLAAAFGLLIVFWLLS